MSHLTFSIVIPAYNRTRNLCEILTHLLGQTYPHERYEILVAAFRLPEGEAEQIRAAAESLSLRIVAVPGDRWNVSKARNEGIAKAIGDIVLLLDADIAACPGLLAAHAACHQTRGCAVAGAVGSFAPYDESRNTEVRQSCELDARWGFVEEALARASPGTLADQSYFAPATCIPLPWAFFWSGNVSIERCFLRDNHLYFDESFEGWGAEDMEWGLRVFQAGASMFFSRGALGIHLPHERDLAANVMSERANLRRLVAKHRCLTAEVVACYNDIEGNKRYAQIRECIVDVFGGAKRYNGCHISVWTNGSKKIAVFGLSSEEAMNHDPRYTYPMLGIATWLSDSELDEVRISQRIYRLPPWLRRDVEREAMRVEVSS